MQQTLALRAQTQRQRLAHEVVCEAVTSPLTLQKPQLQRALQSLERLEFGQRRRILQIAERERIPGETGGFQEPRRPHAEPRHAPAHSH